MLPQGDSDAPTLRGEIEGPAGAEPPDEPRHVLVGAAGPRAAAGPGAVPPRVSGRVRRRRGRVLGPAPHRPGDPDGPLRAAAARRDQVRNGDRPERWWGGPLHLLRRPRGRPGRSIPT